MLKIIKFNYYRYPVGTGMLSCTRPARRLYFVDKDIRATLIHDHSLGFFIYIKNVVKIIFLNN